ncbi:Di-copper centre-containing protein [Polychaeton citri CBS 116435]|uniref:tyrosinase n=1 Tax=Polychaeton citri CBS 116435 TaxID=1314669 RepID=A0A9P4Q4R2_9PEZI|nr:Di-copper centre-containing protein [Polychaeton citri CBS 116435]
MFVHTQLTALLAFTASVFALPRRHFPRQGSNNTASGVTGATQGGVERRMDITLLQSNTDQWNLYLLALQRFKDMDPSDPMSYYQIASIHGAPFQHYNGVDKCDGCPDDTGFCTHASTLFPTWHRSYLGLFEQSLLNNAYAIASEFTGDDNTRYTQAASQLRLPYWDWASKPVDGQAWPSWMEDESVTVTTPTGQQTVENPLKSYAWPSGMVPTSAANTAATVRNVQMSGQTRQNLRSSLWALLSTPQSYNAFSSEIIIDNSVSSLEGIHNTVHGQIGGDMGNPWVAAFDPAFWLHHAMVDHVLSLWQAVYADEWLTPFAEQAPTYYYPIDSTMDSTSPLEPFQASSSSSFLTSDAVRDSSVLNYADYDIASGQSVPSIINNLYRDTQAPIATKRSDNATHNTVMEYITVVEADVMQMNGSFLVWIFVGDFDNNNPSGWAEEPNLAAVNGFFTGSSMDMSGKVRDGVPITGALLKKVETGELADMSTDTTIPWMADNVRFSITSAATGEYIDPSSVPGLSVNTLCSEVTLPQDASSELPQWGQYSSAATH